MPFPCVGSLQPILLLELYNIKSCNVHIQNSVSLSLIANLVTVLLSDCGTVFLKITNDSLVPYNLPYLQNWFLSVDPFLFYAFVTGVLSLSGSSPCRWYIDEDIPDINAFRVGYVLSAVILLFLLFPLTCLFSNLFSP